MQTKRAYIYFDEVASGISLYFIIDIGLYIQEYYVYVCVRVYTVTGRKSNEKYRTLEIV